MKHLLLSVRQVWRRLGQSRNIVPATVILLTALLLLRALQGFNASDDGFVLSAYALAFTSPGSVAYSFLYYWLVNIGAAWNAVFHGLGIYGFRVFECAVLALNSLLVSHVCGMANIRKWCVATALVLAYSRLYWVEVFEYNSASGLVASLIVLLMMTAFTRRSPKWMLFAGAAFGFGVFVRLPNAALGLLLLGIIPYSRLANYPPRTLKMTLFAVIGALTGIAATLAYMSAMGHLPHFKDALADALFLVGTPENSHSSCNMLLSVARNYVIAAACLAALAACPAIYSVLSAKSGRVRGGRFAMALLITAHLLAVVKCLPYNLFMLNGLCLAACLYVGYVRRHDMPVACLSALALLAAVLLPLGSDGGIGTFGIHNLWLAMPFVPCAAVLWLRQFKGERLAVNSAFVSSAFALMLAYNTYRTFMPAYYEQGTRLDDVCNISHPLAGIYTDAKTAHDINGLLAAMRTETAEGDTLLVLGHAPMIHYLTLTSPYLGNPWPWIFGADYCRMRQTCAHRDGNELPVVVAVRADISRGDSLSKWAWGFLTDGQYTAAYQNSTYTLYLPPRKARPQAVRRKSDGM